MKLFERDYNSLTPEENSAWETLKEQEKIPFGSSCIIHNRFREYPKAVRHFESLFPNNYLDVVELKEEGRLSKELVDFVNLINTERVSERDILNFINGHRTYFIVASLLKVYYNFGHHDAYLFPEFPLGTSYKIDYLLVGRNSGGFHFVFVELESPQGGATLMNGELGAKFRKGMSQITDWEAWVEGNFSTLTEVFKTYRRDGALLPDEFFTFDKTRIHFIVIAGRRKDFNEKTYRIRRKRHRENAELILHYDNLIDAVEQIIGKDTY